MWVDFARMVVSTCRMTVKIHNYTVDARNAYPQSLWWTQVVGWQQDPDDPNEPEHAYCWIGPGDGTPGLLFVTVPEGKLGILSAL
jgi:hypothetical protein